MNQKTNIEFQIIDYLIIATAAGFTLFTWIYAGMEYSNLPDQIPSHYNLNGEADGFSGKGVLFFVSGLFTALTVGLFFLAKSTSVHNIQLKTKTANFRSIAIFMPFLSIIQAVAVYTMIGDAKGTFDHSDWILPLILGITVICIVLMFIIIYKNKKS